MFNVGQVYNRRADIHGHYKGQQYGGIATPAAHPYVFIFTSDAGEEFGYSDGFSADGTFRYTGEGQEGDMQMVKGNLAIFEHQNNLKEILLFESVSTGFVRFVGVCNYICHHIEQRPDKNDQLRDAIVFHLDIVPQSVGNTIQSPKVSYLTKPTKSKSLKQLRDIALASTPRQADTKEQLTHVKYRSEAIKLYAKKRANGICEGCGVPSPFETKSGPYLEVHHLTRLADGGADCPENVIALCPTCHRKAHYSVEAADFNAKLIEKALKIEEQLL
ncbi:HNH endonuclease [Vibrio lentus]|uniref:HNH endonuclease n=1 Tax=Vibrio lentus TaxID=136468 RepID=UPI00178CBC04|nr:HNH endonuclease signature motif containing protein [Vibrio lentus]MDN3629140.1 HNH endonuclease signature motif containing protein [Vibrio lentus]